jgi:hypothetical protein
MLRAADKYAYVGCGHCLFCRDCPEKEIYTRGARPAMRHVNSALLLHWRRPARKADTGTRLICNKESQGRDLALIDRDTETTNGIATRLPAIPEQL